MVVVNHHRDIFSEDEESQYGFSLTELLSQLDLSLIEIEIRNKYYSKNVVKKFHYRIGLLLKIWFYMRYHKLTYRTVMHNFTEDDLENLLTREELKKMKEGKFTLPSPSTLHYFVTYRLGEEGIDLIMKFLGSKIVQLLKMNNKSDDRYAIIDSTPLEASRYSPYAAFNPHYKIFMSKAHIISTSGYPLYMFFSEGNENDEKYGHKLIDAVESMNPEFKGVMCDKGYDSFLMHAAIFGKLGAKPIIAICDDAIIHPEATEAKIHKAVNAQWKKGGDVSEPLSKQLKFLYNLDASNCKNQNKFKELVGKYLRNQNLENSQTVEELLNKRGRCESMHSQMKEVLKFNVKKCREHHRSLYLKLDFITTQGVLLTYLQNDCLKNSIAGYS